MTFYGILPRSTFGSITMGYCPKNYIFTWYN